MGLKLANASRWRLVAIRLVLALVLGVATLEGGLRVIRPHHSGLGRLLYQSTRSVNWARAGTLQELLALTPYGYRPHELRSDWINNSKGLRTIEYTEEKPEGALRVLAIGDSFTHGSGGVPYHALWPSQLQRRLQEFTDRPVEVLNLATPAVGPDYQLRLWELEGSKLAADLVVFGFFTGNDFSDSSNFSAAGTWVDRWSRRSFAVRLGRNLYLRARLERGVVERPDPEEPTQTTFERGGVPAAELDPRIRYVYDPEHPALSEETAALVMDRTLRQHQAWVMNRLFPPAAELIRDLRDHVTGSGAELIVLVFPDQVQVVPGLAETLPEEGAEVVIDLDLPQRRLANLFEAEKIPHVDLLPAFRAAREPLYRVRDTHLNPRGNTLAVEHLLALAAGALGLPAPEAAQLLEERPVLANEVE